MRKIRGEETADYEVTLEEVLESLDSETAREIAIGILTARSRYDEHEGVQYAAWVKTMASFFGVPEGNISSVHQITSSGRHDSKVTGFGVRVRKETVS